jgi:5-methylcytosine-specific restriction endonuclease McrA
VADRHNGRRYLPDAEDEVCHYCKKELKSRRDRTVDHILPESLGGRSARFNYVLSCRGCNEDKADSFPTCSCRKCRKSVKIHREAWNIKPPKAA